MAGIFARFQTDIQGTFAIWTGLLALPLLSAVTYTIDLNSAVRDKAELNSAVDAAVLAAVNNNAISLSDKRDFSIKAFYDNYQGNAATVVDAKVDKNTVSLTVSAKFPTSISASLGLVDVNVVATGTAILAEEDIVCVLALHPDGAGTIKYSGSLQFAAPTCSIQANSKNANAIVSETRYAPAAKGFCSHGGVKGDFYPSANGECRVIADPYKDLAAPDHSLNCKEVDANMLVEIRVPANFDLSRFRLGLNPIGGGGNGGGGENGVGNGNAGGPRNINQAPGPGYGGGDSNQQRITVDPSLTFPIAVTSSGAHIPINPGDPFTIIDDNANIRPDTYCGGLTIAGRNVTFEPGVHYMWNGPLVVKDGAIADGEDLTVVLGGSNATLLVESGAEIDIAAQRQGPHAGLAIMEDVRDPFYEAGRTSVINDGAMTVTGTVYLPGQHLHVSGTSRVGAQAPSTSFITDTIHFADHGRMTIAVDAAAAGLPPVQPRSESGARLAE